MSTPPMPSAAARWAGAAYVVAAVAFTLVFGYLAAVFDYPDVLDGQAGDVLPRLLALGGAGRAAWAVYALLPLLLIPGALAARRALGATGRGRLELAVQLSVVSAVAMTLGLARWSSVHWELARAWGTADAGQRAVLAAVFDGLNAFLGRFLGEFVGELTMYGAFLLLGAALLRAPRFPRWVGWLGVATGTVGWVAMFRNVTTLVASAAELANALLPLWLLVLGVALARRG